MTRIPRFLFVFVALGVGLVAFSVLGTAKLTGSNGTDSKEPKAGVKDTSRGVVCLGTADIDEQQVPVYPDNFPPTSYPIKVKSVKKKEGDRVKKGDEIASIDDEIPRKLVAKAEAGLTASKAQLTKAKQAVDAHKVAIDVQNETVSAKEVELNSKRLELDTAKKQADKIGGIALDDYKAKAESVKAYERAVEIEKKRLNGLVAIQPTVQLDLARADIDRAQAELDIANEVLRQCVYRSPVDGTIHRSSLYEGLIFGPQMRKEPIVVQPDGKLFVRAEVNQEYAHRVSVGQKATVIDYSNTSLTWKGKVTKIADHFTQKRGNNSGGIELFSSGDDPILEVTIEIEDVKNPTLRQGQRVRINIGIE